MDIRQFEYIKKNLSSIDLVKLDKILGESIQGASRIRDIVRHLKGFSHSDRNEKTTIDLHELLNSVSNMTSAELKLRAQLQKNYAKDIPLLKFNSGTLHQVFLNILMNAIQAIPINNPTKNIITITTALENNQVRIDISDTGSGMDQQVLSKIFDPFFTTKPVGIGTGLGLSISNDIIKNEEGKIIVKSTPGKGSTFSVYLPLRIADHAHIEKQDSKEKLTSTSKHILIIDDEPFLLKCVERMLEDIHEVTAVISAPLAIELLEKNPNAYDIILCDLSMPIMNGGDFYNHIKNKFLGNEKKIIFMTGGSYTSEINQFISSTNNLCLDKPFEQPQLLQIIDQFWINKK
jgi:two-component system cell cycle sensor histidine kinase/response regulator CckA